MNIASLPRPVQELKGYVRLGLAPGESKIVTFHLPVDQLAFYDADLNLVVESGSFKVMAASSSADIRAQDVFDGHRYEEGRGPRARVCLPGIYCLEAIVCGSLPTSGPQKMVSSSTY